MADAELAAINASLLRPDGMRDYDGTSWSGVLLIPSRNDYRWWSCSHRHLGIGYALDCAEAAHAEVAAGVHTHRLKGLDGGR